MDACGQGEGGQKRDFFVDVINGWPLTELSAYSLVLNIVFTSCINWIKEFSRIKNVGQLQNLKTFKK